MLVILLALLLTILLIAGLALLVQARARRQAAGLPAGRIVYADTGAWERCEAPLFAPRYRLTGRPDYLVRAGRHLIPVEVKPNRSTTSPYLSDILQLGAYCLLVEEVHHQPPPHGILKYRDAAFEIDYTPGLRQQVLDSLDSIRRDRAADEVDRSHEEPARCAGCGVRAACNQRLA
jgi:CRISPR-associated exonuclease Cas4